MLVLKPMSRSWLAPIRVKTVLLAASAVSRIALYYSMPNPGNVWWSLVLPVAATLLYILITMLQGQEQFYKTAIPVWMLALFAAVWAKDGLGGRATIALFWIALFCIAFLYTDIFSGIFTSIVMPFFCAASDTSATVERMISLRSTGSK